jgi:hypothetical protein
MDGDEVRTTIDGVRYTVHPSRLVQGCVTGRDCIPAIDDPEFVSADEATDLDPDARVVGLDVDGEARAYPLSILRGHEIVNDDIAGRPVAVTYCPLCRSGLVFSRRVDGRRLDFGVSGKLLDANLVMYDRQTGTYWSQLRARAIVGDLVPETLEQVPSTLTTWWDWRQGHPESLVLYGSGLGSGRDPYLSYREREGVGFGVDTSDDRLHEKTIVYGVTAGGEAVAYPESAVVDAGLIQDRVGGVPVLLVQSPADGGVRAFDRRIGSRTLSFEFVGERLVSGDGTRWNASGEALDGPLQGTQLAQLATHGIYWFAWRSTHPGTAVFGADE